MKRWIKVLCIGMFFSLLTGCGKGRGDVASDYQKNAEGGTFEAGEPSNISYQVAGNNNVTFTVDADVTGGERLSGSRCADNYLYCISGSSSDDPEPLQNRW